MSVKNELMHYGVLGMRWGVHRSREPGGSKKPVYDTERDTIKKGSIVYRVSSKKDEVDSGQTFIFTDSKDADKFANKIKESRPDTFVYKLSLKVTKDLVGPSEKERVDTFLDLYKRRSVAQVVDNVAIQARQQGIKFKDKDGDKTLSTYRAYTIAVSKNVDRLGEYVNYVDREQNKLDVRRDDYMRGFTRVRKSDKTPIDSLDSAYLVFSRSESLKTIGVEEVAKRDPVKHSNISDDLYPGSSFFQPRTPK